MGLALCRLSLAGDGVVGIRERDQRAGIMEGEYRPRSGLSDFPIGSLGKAATSWRMGPSQRQQQPFHHRILWVQSRPVRVRSRTPGSRRGMLWYPSILISCNQSGRSGGWSTNLVSYGSPNPAAPSLQRAAVPQPVVSCLRRSPESADRSRAWIGTPLLPLRLAEG